MSQYPQAKNNRIYISGKITGTPDYLQRFRIVQENLEDRGWQVLNPADVCSRVPELSHEEYMGICMILMNLCDSLYMLDGWEDSKGAELEHRCAVSLNKNIYYERGNK